MSELMTWQEIEEAFDSEWVLIEDPEMTPSLEILRGKVIFHSRSRAEVHERMVELPKMHHAVMQTGESSMKFLINWGLPGGYGIYDWSEMGLDQNDEQDGHPVAGQ